jgi:hypothetical protein
MKRDELRRDKRADATTFLDCNACMSTDPRQPGRLPAEMRARWRCGWVQEQDRATKSVRNDPPSWGCTSADVCPGYLISLPQVVEAANAHTCWKEGQLAQAYPGADISLESLLMESVLILNQALGEAEAEAMAKLNG